MKLTLKIWRQKNASAKGEMVTYPIDGIDGDMSFLEMMDVLNDEEEFGLLKYMFPTVDEEALKNVADITHLTRVEAATDNPRITSGVSTRTSVEIAGLLFDGFSLMEAADITIYPQYDATGGVDSERTFVRQIVQKFVSDGSDENLFTDHEIEGDADMS